MIAVLLVVFAALAATYFIVIRPMTRAEETTAETVTPDSGESELYEMLLMFPQVKREDMASIEVHNPTGTYKFVYSDKKRDFMLEGYEKVAYNAEKFSAFVISTGTTYALEKLSDHATEEELEDFGLSEAADPAYYSITTKKGAVHTVKIGSQIISGGGYYAMYNDRDAIYVLSASFHETVLAPVEELLSPLLTGAIPTDEYYLIDNFKITRYGEEFLSCRNMTKTELSQEESNAIAKAITVNPAGYSLSMYYNQTQQKLASYQGEAVASVDISKASLEKFGLSDEPYVISYDYKDFKFRLVASEPVDGYYYVLTSAFDVIVKVPEADFEFLRWDLLRWVESAVFSRGIAYVKDIAVTGGDINETFRLNHRPDDNPNLVVVGDVCGQIADVRNFREFYKTLLLVSIEGYAPEDALPKEENLIVKFTVTTNGGGVTEYGFYRYSTRRCLLTINGEGTFYVLSEMAEKVLSDAEKVMNGEPVDATAKN